MAEKYPPGSWVIANATYVPQITKDKWYEVVSESCYHSDPKKREKDEWVWIMQDNGTYNGWKPEYFTLVKREYSMEPDFSLEEIENAQHVYEALNGDK